MRLSDTDEVDLLALKAALTLLLMSAKFGNGHVSSAISCVDLVVACFRARNLNECEEIILSKGHAATAWYATLFQLGLISKDTLRTFTKNDSPLGVHLTKNEVTRSSLSTGSLGHGLSFAVGLALASRIQKTNLAPIVILGDGELNEGSVWEAAQYAGRSCLGNLTAIVDMNGVQAVGTYGEISARQDVRAKFISHGWEVQNVDVVNASSVYQKLISIEESTSPVAIIANSWESQHFQYFRRSVEWHYRKPTLEEIEKSIPSQLSIQDFEACKEIFA